MYRLTILIDRYVPITGGAQQIVHEIACGLHARGYHITVLTRRLDKSLQWRENIDGIVVRRFGPARPRLLSKVMAFIGMVWYSQRHASQTDVLVGVPVSLVSDLLPTWFAAAITKKPYVVRATALNMFDTLLARDTQNRSKWKNRFFLLPRIWRATLTRAKTIITQTDAVSARLSDYGLTNIATCQAGVDTVRFSPVDSGRKAVLRQKLGIPEDHLIVITVGRYTEAKNQITLLRSVNRIYTEQPRAKLTAIVLGGTEPRLASSNEQQLKQFVVDQKLESVIRFYDDVKNVEDYLGASDVFVFPSYFDEGFSNALMEAMVSGLAVCSGDIPQTRSVVPETLIRYFQPTDDKALAELLAQHLNDRADCAIQGQRVAAFARSRFSLGRVVERYDRFLSEAVEGQKQAILSSQS